jgi:hypothetical protein
LLQTKAIVLYEIGYGHLLSHHFKVIVCYHSHIQCGLGRVTVLTSMYKVPIQCKFLVFSGDFFGKYQYKEMVEMPAATLKLDIGHSLFLMHEHLYLGWFNFLTALTVHQPPCIVVPVHP